MEETSSAAVNPPVKEIRKEVDVGGEVRSEVLSRSGSICMTLHSQIINVRIQRLTAFSGRS